MHYNVCIEARNKPKELQLSCIKAGFTTWRAGLRDYSYGCNHNTFQSKVASLSDHISVLGCLLSGRLEGISFI